MGEAICRRIWYKGIGWSRRCLLWPSNRQKKRPKKDDLIELLIDARALRADDDPWIRGMLPTTSRNAVEMLDEFGPYRSIARDVIVEVRLVTHLRPYIEDDELLTFEKEDLRRRSNVHDKPNDKPMAALMIVTCGVDLCQT